MAYDRWKYLVVSVKFDWKATLPNERLQAELDDQGNKGWELVEILHFSNSLTTSAQLVFKKPA
jgi:uncharacterized protein DUF4177